MLNNSKFYNLTLKFINIKSNKLGFFLVFCLLLASCESKKIETDKQKFSYAIGRQVAQSIKNQNLDQKLDPQIFLLAVSDVLNDTPSRVAENELTLAIRNMNQKSSAENKEKFESNKATGEKFLEENKSKEGIQLTDSGLQYKVMVEGKGKSPSGEDKVKIHYKGTLIDNSEFDSSYKRNTPATFVVNQTIPGMVEALKLMKIGSKWMLYTPNELAYKSRALPGIPPGSALIFELELIEIL